MTRLPTIDALSWRPWRITQRTLQNDIYARNFSAYQPDRKATAGSLIKAMFIIYLCARTFHMFFVFACTTKTKKSQPA